MRSPSKRFRGRNLGHPIILGEVTSGRGALCHRGDRKQGLGHPIGCGHPGPRSSLLGLTRCYLRVHSDRSGRCADLIGDVDPSAWVTRTPMPVHSRCLINPGGLSDGTRRWAFGVGSLGVCWWVEAALPSEGPGWAAACLPLYPHLVCTWGQCRSSGMSDLRLGPETEVGWTWRGIALGPELVTEEKGPERVGGAASPSCGRGQA